MNTQDQIDPVDNDVKRNGTETKEKDVSTLTDTYQSLRYCSISALFQLKSTIRCKSFY